MFLRRNRRRVRGEEYEYWTLVESVRTERGPRQRIVGMIGKLSSLKAEERIGWEEIGRLWSGQAKKEADLFDKPPEIPAWASIDVGRVSVERERRFGDVYLALALWRRLKLDDIFDRLQEEGREDIPWAKMFCVTTLERLCQPSSELAIAEGWYEKTALEDILGVSIGKVEENRLYRTLDHLLPHKDEVCKHLQERYAEWFSRPWPYPVVSSAGQECSFSRCWEDEFPPALPVYEFGGWAQ